MYPVEMAVYVCTSACVGGSARADEAHELVDALKERGGSFVPSFVAVRLRCSF